jgi:hypothetical protein
MNTMGLHHLQPSVQYNVSDPEPRREGVGSCEEQRTTSDARQSSQRHCDVRLESTANEWSVACPSHLRVVGDFKPLRSRICWDVRMRACACLSVRACVCVRVFL